MDIRVGSWIRRERGGKGHLVESLVSGDVITRCGKRMRDEPSQRGELVVHDGPVSRGSRPLDWPLCEAGCQRFGA
jgi:hypothetical protein